MKIPMNLRPRDLLYIYNPVPSHGDFFLHFTPSLHAAFCLQVQPFDLVSQGKQSIAGHS